MINILQYVSSTAISIRQNSAKLHFKEEISSLSLYIEVWNLMIILVKSVQWATNALKILKSLETIVADSLYLCYKHYVCYGL